MKKKETVRKRKQKVTEMIKRMAKELNKSEVTIRRELKRGEDILKDKMYYDYITYSSQFSTKKGKKQA